MRKIFLSVAAISILSGCTENTNPYMDSPENAKAKTQQCLDNLHAAIAERDEKKVTTLANEPSCTQASYAHAKHVNKSIIEPVVVPKTDPRQITPETSSEKTDSQHGTKIDASAIDSAKAEQQAKWADELKKMDFRDYYQLSKKCLTSMVERKTVKCAVVRGIMEERYQAEIDIISQKYQGDELEAYAKEVCTADTRDDAKCEMALRSKGKI